MFRKALLVAATALALPFGAVAQPQPAPPPAPARATDAGQVTGRRLPPDSTTQHVLELPGRTLRFTATAGALPLVDPQGAAQAEIGFVSYTLAGSEPRSRPVTFAVNGGPGASSAYLHLLVAGPWRLPLGEGSFISPSQSPALVPNAETWLDFTDLVFIDPVSTGYSRAAGSEGEIRDRYYTIDTDIASISAAISRWLRANDRLGSPKMFLGESYGGFRGPLLAQKLQSEIGIGMSGLILLSPVLDFGWLAQPRHDPLEFAARLPSLRAAFLERSGAVTREALADAERYASGDYVTDLLRGLQDEAAVARVSAKVAELTGLDPAFVRERAGRIDTEAFQREFLRVQGRVPSAYDTGVSAFEPDPTAPGGQSGDAVLTAMTAPLTSAIVDHLWRKLNWPVPNQRYELLNGGVSGAWRFGRGRRPPQVVENLKQLLALDPRVEVLVAHGVTDLVTPYFTSELLLRQLPAYGGERRARLATFPGGHMFYTRDASRSAFRAEAVAMYRRALVGRSAD